MRPLEYDGILPKGVLPDKGVPANAVHMHANAMYQECPPCFYSTIVQSKARFLRTAFAFRQRQVCQKCCLYHSYAQCLATVRAHEQSVFVWKSVLGTVDVQGAIGRNSQSLLRLF